MLANQRLFKDNRWNRILFWSSLFQTLVYKMENNSNTHKLLQMYEYGLNLKEKNKSKTNSLILYESGLSAQNLVKRKSIKGKCNICRRHPTTNLCAKCGLNTCFGCSVTSSVNVELEQTTLCNTCIFEKLQQRDAPRNLFGSRFANQEKLQLYIKKVVKVNSFFASSLRAAIAYFRNAIASNTVLLKTLTRSSDLGFYTRTNNALVSAFKNEQTFAINSKRTLESLVKPLFSIFSKVSGIAKSNLTKLAKLRKQQEVEEKKVWLARKKLMLGNDENTAKRVEDAVAAYNSKVTLGSSQEAFFDETAEVVLLTHEESVSVNGKIVLALTEIEQCLYKLHQNVAVFFGVFGKLLGEKAKETAKVAERLQSLLCVDVRTELVADLEQNFQFYPSQKPNIYPRLSSNKPAVQQGTVKTLETVKIGNRPSMKDRLLELQSLTLEKKETSTAKERKDSVPNLYKKSECKEQKLEKTDSDKFVNNKINEKLDVCVEPEKDIKDNHEEKLNEEGKPVPLATLK